MRTGHLKQALGSLAKANVSVFLWGQPSSAKSSIVKQFAAETGRKLIDLRLSQMEAVDLMGIPFLKDGRTQWATPAWWPEEGDNAVVFLDEFNQAAQSVQAPAYQLIHDRQVGGNYLPKDTLVIAAGNRQTDRSITQKMGTALKNRFVHITVEVNNDDFIAWALGDGRLHDSIVGFLRFRPALLNELGQRGTSQEETSRIGLVMEQTAFATPRSWEFLNKILEARPPTELEWELFAGAVGEGVATEFTAYLKYVRELPDLDKVLLDPEKAPIPKEPATLYAVATGLGRRITADNFQHAITYLKRIKQKEFEVMAIRDAFRANPGLNTLPAFVQWMRDNHRKFLA